MGSGFGLGLGITSTVGSQSELCIAMIQPSTPAAAEPKLKVGALLLSINGVNVQRAGVDGVATMLKTTTSATIEFSMPNKFTAKASFIQRSATVQPKTNQAQAEGADGASTLQLRKSTSQHGTQPQAASPRVASSRWYIGATSAKDANLLLEGAATGSFVVRESAQASPFPSPILPFPFLLSPPPSACTCAKTESNATMHHLRMPTECATSPVRIFV